MRPIVAQLGHIILDLFVPACIRNSENIFAVKRQLFAWFVRWNNRISNISDIDRLGVLIYLK